MSSYLVRPDHLCTRTKYLVTDLVPILWAVVWDDTAILGECIALWGEPNELSIQYRIYIFIQYVDS